MGEFGASLRQRVAGTRGELRRAEAAGDPFAVAVHTADLENLLRLAVRHGVDVDAAVPGGADEERG